LIQRLVRQWRVPLFLAGPAVWVSFEYLRSLGPLGFPWFFLGHSQATHLSLIQIADFSGACGVSFLVGLVNGTLAELIIWVREKAFRRSIPAVVAATAALVFTFFYGQWRLNQQTTRPGPVVSVVQDDFPMYVDRDPAGMQEMLNGYLAVSSLASVDKPDLLVWPETCVGVPINPEFLQATVTDRYDVSEQRYARQVAGILADHARTAGSNLIVGALTRRINPKGYYPAVDKYNSALVYDRRGNYVDRYDKIRLVLFGEAVPFRYTIPKLYWFLNEHMTPYGRGGFEYSLTAGTEYKRFAIQTPQGDFRYSVAICYEDTMADLIRGFTAPAGGRKQIDFLVNVSNDGWFDHSCELLQHFYVCVFRAVENRIAIARAVNTGISGFINPDGRIEGMVTAGSRQYGPGIRGFSTRAMKIDSRVTLYSRIGQWPVGAMTGLILIFGLVVPLFMKLGPAGQDSETPKAGNNPRAKK